MSISVVLNTKNSAATIAAALDSAAFADEVIVVDMQSSDRTVEIAQKRGAKIFTTKDVGFVEPARQLALSKAKSEWILVLDADEVVPLTLAEQLQAIAADKYDSIMEADCYYIARRNRIWGKWLEHTGWWPDYILRFFRKGYVTWPPELHSVPVTKGKVSQLPAKKELALEHYNYNTVSEYLQRMDRYTTIQADEKSSTAEPVSALSVLQAFRKEFVRRLGAEQGFLDAQNGVGLSLGQALSETMLQLKIWENQGFQTDGEVEVATLQAELKQLVSELKYWFADYQVHNSQGLNQIYWRCRRKFRI